MNSKLIQKLDVIKSKQTLKRIFLTGSSGQIGQELIPALSHVYGKENLFLSDIVQSPLTDYQFEYLDCLDTQSYIKSVQDFKPCVILHLPAILSGNAEKDIYKGIRVNQETFLNAIKAAESVQCKLFTPSSIAAYGFSDFQYRENVNEMTYQRPETIYGIMKIFVELMGNYMKHKRCIDFRSLRYPGVMSSIMPDGGTTDYAIEMMYRAIQNKNFSCYIEKDIALPFLYIDDLISETIRFLEADQSQLKYTAYSLSNFSLTPEELYNILKQDYPEFQMNYSADFRNKIARKWPASLDCSSAKNDWNFQPDYDKQDTIKMMLSDIKTRLN